MIPFLVLNLSNQGCLLLTVQRHQICIVPVLIFILISKTGKMLSTSIQQLV